MTIPVTGLPSVIPIADIHNYFHAIFQRSQMIPNLTLLI